MRAAEERLRKATEQPNTPPPPAKPAPKPMAFPADAETARAAQRDWAEHLGVAPVTTNSVGMRLSLLPPGSARIGSPVGEEGRDSNEPQWTVRLTRPIRVSSQTVSNAAFRRFRPNHDSGSYVGRGPDGKAVERSVNADDQPVVNVLHADAVAFCEWLSQQPEERRAGRRYRLPTEAEWEYACRAGSPSRFWWGAAVDVTRMNFADRNCPTPKRDGTLDNGFAVAAAVGSFPPNPWGLTEMHGNVWEWCADVYGPYPKSEQTDPAARIGKPDETLVLRGGSWAVSPVLLRCAVRNSATADYRSAEIGFRVVCEERR